jgi:hypothetical protein
MVDFGVIDTIDANADHGSSVSLSHGFPPRTICFSRCGVPDTLTVHSEPVKSAVLFLHTAPSGDLKIKALSTPSRPHDPPDVPVRPTVVSGIRKREAVALLGSLGWSPRLPADIAQKDHDMNA